MSRNESSTRIGFVGAGKMATALARGLCTAGIAAPERLFASDVLPAASEQFAAQTGAAVVQHNADVARQCDVLFLSVKPQHFPGILAELAPHVEQRHLIISIAAGIPLKAIAQALGAERRLVRVMPNAPCLVSASASAYCIGGAATPDDAQTAQRLLSAVGEAFSLPEPLLDAVTGLSGSGPAYTCVVIEALADGGVKMGLPRDVAFRLAAQTVLGTAKMLLETGQHPAALKDAVASPGGTTIAGLHELERGGLRAALISAVEAATRRSQELGRGSG